jgi:hypothetical protein
MRIKSFSQFISEALELSDARKATEIFLNSGGKERYNQVFKGKDRLYYNFGKSIKDEGQLEKEIKNYLRDNGYYLEDYQKGLAKKEGDNKNIFKVQKILIKLGAVELKNKMDADPARFSSTKTDKKVVISRHGIDLAGQSTGRDWTSCKKIGNINGHYVFKEIKEGSLVAYLIKSDDINIQKPIARILIGVFYNDLDPLDYILYPDTSTYGNYTQKDFFDFVKDWCNKFNSVINPNYKGIYNLSNECYADNRMKLNAGGIDKISIKFLYDELLGNGILGDNSKYRQILSDYGEIKYRVEAPEIYDFFDFVYEKKLGKDLFNRLIKILKQHSSEKDFSSILNNLDNNKIKDYINTNPSYIITYLQNLKIRQDINIDKSKYVKDQLLNYMSKEEGDSVPEIKTAIQNNIINNSSHLNLNANNIAFWEWLIS